MYAYLCRLLAAAIANEGRFPSRSTCRSNQDLDRREGGDWLRDWEVKFGSMEGWDACGVFRHHITKAMRKRSYMLSARFTRPKARVDGKRYRMSSSVSIWVHDVKRDSQRSSAALEDPARVKC